jgi:hypothetical protein
MTQDMSDKLTERLRAAIAQVVNDAVSEELDSCERLINERIDGADKDSADHMSDPIEVRRELAAYSRGLRDAYHALRERRKA